MSYIKKKSQKQEQRTAKEFSGRTQIASGALSGMKGDVRTGTRNGSSFNEGDFLIENKFTDKDFYKLELKIWEKISQEALRDNLRTPMMQIDIQDLSLVVMAENDLLAQFGDISRFYFDITIKRSYRLGKATLINLFDFEDYEVIFLDFDSGKKSTSLAIMKKDDFLSR